MLSVGGSGARSRSKSPGRRDERDHSRSRDARDLSPMVISKQLHSAEIRPAPRRRDYDEEDDLISDSDDDDHDDRRRDTMQRVASRDYDRRRDYGEVPSDARRKSDRIDDEPRQYRGAKPGDVPSRREEPAHDKEYAMPGGFDDDDDRAYNERTKPGYGAQPTAGPYEALPQFQYAQIDPNQLKYVKQGQTTYTRTPRDEGPAYSRTPGAQVTVEPNRAQRGGSQSHRNPMDKYRAEPETRYQQDASRYKKSERQTELERAEEARRQRQKELERAEELRKQQDLAKQQERIKEYQRQEEIKRQQALIEKEKQELALVERRKRELDHYKKEREERDAELRQKAAKTVTIRDERDYRDEARQSKRSDKYDDDRYRKSDRRDERGGGTRRRYDDEDDSDDSDGGDRRVQKIYPDRYDDRYESRRDGGTRRGDKEVSFHERHGSRGGRESPEKKSSKPQFVEIHPGGRGALAAPPSPGLNARTRGLSVSSLAPGAGTMMLAAPGALGHHRSGSMGAPPGSPLLESYKGTYQTISPMPSPMALAHHADDSDLSDLDLAMPGALPGRIQHRRPADEESDGEDDSDASRSERKPKSILKRHRELGNAYDPERDATALAQELKKAQPSPELLIKILPTLRNDSIVALRSEYKKHAKIQGKGINIAKHIKMKVGTTNVGKAAYATALGRWESEAHWANFWYQSGSSRRELLIEALFGRSNAEIRAIKDAFSDKRYGDSLTRCMEAELKKDKFRLAVLKALEGKRGEEGDEVDRRQVHKDVAELHKAVASKEGGETAMINILVSRSDEHLRYILKEYEAEYSENFARKMIGKSQNLVGETLAHILNGVLNRPVRDALLLRQAIAETSKDRAELIISRLVRFHWEPRHLERVKVEYRRRYGAPLEQDIHDGTKGDFCDFCIGLCTGAIR